MQSPKNDVLRGKLKLSLNRKAIENVSNYAAKKVDEKAKSF